MQDESEKAVLCFLENLAFPGIRFGEGNKQVIDYLKSKGYKFTPDLVAGPKNIEDAPIEGLFFVEVIQPSTDLLFKSEYYEDLKFNIPQHFKTLLTNNIGNNTTINIDMLPNTHQECYLDKYNKKLDKYAHQRKYVENGQLLVTSNFGIVHHFNLGKLEDNNISNSKELITLLDYLRFYKRIAPSDNVDLVIAENKLLQEILNHNQNTPFVQIVGREVEDLPCLFQILHVIINKNNSVQDLAIIVLNTTIIDHSDMVHPVHKWFFNIIFDPRSTKHLNTEFKQNIFNITIKDDVFT